METTPILPTLLSAVGVVAAVLLGVWGIVARYAVRIEDRMERMRDRIDAQRQETTEQLGHLRDRIDAQGKETGEQLGQLRERMAKLEGLLEGLREAITGKRAA